MKSELSICQKCKHVQVKNPSGDILELWCKDQHLVARVNIGEVTVQTYETPEDCEFKLEHLLQGAGFVEDNFDPLV